MTAQPDDPTDDRIDAVARVLSSNWRNMHTNESLGMQRMLARAVMADPGARAALLAEWAETDPKAVLDALTRAGVLHEEHDRQQAWNRAPQFHAARLVTGWREVST